MVLDPATARYHGQPPPINQPSLNLPTHYGDGLNAYQFVGSNPIDRRDPLGLYFGLVDSLFSHSEGATLTAGGAAVPAAAGLGLVLVLAGLTASMQAVVLGGYTSDAFDTYLDAVEAMMNDAYSASERLFVTAEATSLAVFAMSQAQAVERAVSLKLRLSEHYVKLATGGPEDRNWNGWRKEVLNWLNTIERLVGRMKGKTQQNWRNWLDAARTALEEIARGGPGRMPPMPG
jgi:hypothetical protein